MKKLFGAAKLDEARSCTSPVQNITSTNLVIDSDTARWMIFKYPDTQYTAVINQDKAGNLSLYLVVKFPAEHQTLVFLE
jgi:light-regulated signal transduction histidine kinase (bacteriophytochrome)